MIGTSLIRKMFAFAIIVLFIVSVVVVAVPVSAQNPQGNSSSNSMYNVVITQRTTLHSNLYGDNLTIAGGATLITNGYSIILQGAFINFGTVCSGYNSNSITQGYISSDLPESTGGSGGGASAGTNYGVSAYYSGSTMVPGGIANANSNGGNGNQLDQNQIIGYITTNSISKWFTNGIQNYISGAAGGSVRGNYGTGSGGYGSYGIYIQANAVIAGTINAFGESVYGGTCDYGMQGAGGGGSIIIAYGNGGITKGICNSNGGLSLDYNYYGYNGGNGGNGTIFAISYAGHSAPVKVSYNVPQWAFDGAFACYHTSDTSGTKSNTGQSSYYAYINQSIEQVSVPLQEFTLYYNDNGSVTSYSEYFNNPSELLAVNSTSLTLINSGTTKNTGDFNIGGLNVTDFTISTGVSVSTPAGQYLADQINFHNSSAQSQINATMWISQSSGMLLKFSFSGTIFSYNTYTNEKGTVNLVKTNIAMAGPSPKSSILEYAIIGGIVAIAAVALFMGYRAGYLNIHKLSSPRPGHQIPGKSSVQSIKNLRELRDSGLISEEEFDNKLSEILSRK